MNMITDPGYCKTERDLKGVSKKIKFLLRQQKQLKEQVEDLKNLNQINKQALIISLSPPEDCTQNQRLSAEKQRQMMTLILKENKKLAAELEIRIKERNMAQNKAYMSQRIISQNMEFEQELSKEYQEKIEKLMEHIRTKDFVLHEMEALKMIPASAPLDSKTYIVYREIHTPYNLMNKLNNEIEELKNMLHASRMEVGCIKSDLEEEKSRNEFLAIELEKLRTVANKPYRRLVFTRSLDNQFFEDGVIEAFFQSKKEKFEKSLNSLKQAQKGSSRGSKGGYRGEKVINQSQYSSARISGSLRNNTSNSTKKIDSMGNTAASLRTSGIPSDRSKCKMEKIENKLKSAYELMRRRGAENQRLIVDRNERNQYISNLLLQISIYERNFYSNLTRFRRDSSSMIIDRGDNGEGNFENHEINQQILQQDSPYNSPFSSKNLLESIKKQREIGQFQDSQDNDGNSGLDDHQLDSRVKNIHQAFQSQDQQDDELEDDQTRDQESNKHLNISVLDDDLFEGDRSPKNDIDCESQEDYLGKQDEEGEILPDYQHINKINQNVLRKKHQKMDSFAFSGQKQSSTLKNFLSKMSPTNKNDRREGNRVSPNAINVPKEGDKFNFERNGTSTLQLFQFNDTPIEEEYYLNQAKTYLRGLSIALKQDISQKARFMYSTLKEATFQKFEGLPVPQVKVNRTMSCPDFKGLREERKQIEDDGCTKLDQTINLNLDRGVNNEFYEGYGQGSLHGQSLDLDMDDFQIFIRGGSKGQDHELFILQNILNSIH